MNVTTEGGRWGWGVWREWTRGQRIKREKNEDKGLTDL